MADDYLLSTLANHWRRRGLRVQAGASYPPDSDICILHHDISRLDESAVPAAPCAAPVINGRVLDISKRRFSSLLLQPGDDWTGPVIIKSNLNHYGAPENKFLRRDLIERVRRRLADISWRGAQMLPTRSYPVLESIKDVPDWVWASSELLVEKFVPERTRDGGYAVRGWVFFGDRGYVYRVISDEPIVKPGSATRIEYFTKSGPPAELMRQRAELMFDFGKFDYVVHDGEAVLIDANKTPVFHGNPEAQRMRWLSSGIDAFL